MARCVPSTGQWCDRLGQPALPVGFSRLADLNRPDFVLFDLDRGQASFADVVAVAKALQAALQAEGRKAFVKTSGKTGLHVFAPWQRQADYAEAPAWTLGMAH